MQGFEALLHFWAQLRVCSQRESVKGEVASPRAPSLKEEHSLGLQLLPCRGAEGRTKAFESGLGCLCGLPVQAARELPFQPALLSSGEEVAPTEPEALSCKGPDPQG